MSDFPDPFNIDVSTNMNKKKEAKAFSRVILGQGCLESTVLVGSTDDKGSSLTVTWGKCGPSNMGVALGLKHTYCRLVLEPLEDNLKARQSRDKK